jgi:ribosomal-protein-serine acetyltransferase
MRVTFLRRPDHQRDYALVERDDGTAGRRYGGPAGPRLPYDIVLLVVERELRIRDGLWGGIAAGLALDRGPGLRAEQLADLVSSAAALDHLTPAMIGRLAKARLSVLPDAAADPVAIAMAARALQVEAARWARLRVGEELCYEWPARLCFRPPDREHERMDARPDEVISRGPVTLRRWRPDDLEAVLAAVTDSAGHLSPWLSWAAGYRRESAQEFLTRAALNWADGTAYDYAITTGGALAGGIGLMARIGPGGLEIGYWVHQAYARRGLATAATAALVEQAFRLPGVDRVEIVHDELNVASGGVPRKLGFTEVERRPMDVRAPAGTGVGVIWRLVR